MTKLYLHMLGIPHIITRDEECKLFLKKRFAYDFKL